MEHELAVAQMVATARPRLRQGITVCIACHPARVRNGMLQRAFNSAVTQTLQPAAIVVVNDLEREGAGHTRQRLLESVNTEWIAWLDSDDEWDATHLEKLYRVALDTDSVYVYSWFKSPYDPLGHFGLPFNPCTPHHTTMNVLVQTELAREVGFPPTEVGPFSNEDWAFITGVSKLACERGLKMTHLAERTWTYHMAGQNSSGRPGQGDAA